MSSKRGTYSMFCIICIGMIFTNICFSQGGERTKEGSGMGYFMIGFQNSDIDAIGSRLEDNGYPSLSDRFLTLGGGGQGMINKLLIGGEGHALIGESTTQNHVKTQISGGFGLFNIGYAAVATKQMRLYPMLGLGGGGLSLSLLDKSEVPTFDQVLKNPKRGAQLSTAGFLLSLSLGADYLFIMEENADGIGGLIFGVRLGYMFAPVKGDWLLDDVEISEGPEIGVTGPFIRLAIGGGGWSYKK